MGQEEVVAEHGRLPERVYSKGEPRFGIQPPCDEGSRRLAVSLGPFDVRFLHSGNCIVAMQENTSLTGGSC